MWASKTLNPNSELRNPKPCHYRVLLSVAQFSLGFDGVFTVGVITVAIESQLKRTTIEYLPKETYLEPKETYYYRCHRVPVHMILSPASHMVPVRAAMCGLVFRGPWGRGAQKGAPTSARRCACGQTRGAVLSTHVTAACESIYWPLAQSWQAPGSSQPSTRGKLKSPGNPRRLWNLVPDASPPPPPHAHTAHARSAHRESRQPRVHQVTTYLLG